MLGHLKALPLPKCEREGDKVKSIGDQQVGAEELGWLAGAIDGEGHIGMHLYVKKRGERVYRVEVALTNCNRAFLEKAISIWRRLGCNPYIQEKKVKPGWSQSWMIRTNKISHIVRLLTPIVSMLTSKKERAELLLRFCNRRLAIAKKAGVSLRSSARSNPYTEEDLSFFEEFKRFHRAKPTPTTIPLGVGLSESEAQCPN